LFGVNSDMRVFAVVLAAVALAGQARAAAHTVALPSDVRDGLTAESIEIGSPIGAPARLPVSAARAKRIVRPMMRFYRGYSGGVYLVRITGHPGPFDPLPPGRGWTTITPLQVGDLAWIVVIRDATIPITGPLGGSYQATLVVIVETTRPAWVTGFTIT
jgi:hypothetical protein